MSDLFILYCAFMYLFTLGAVMAAWKDLDSNVRIGAIISLIGSPIITPIIIGAIHHENNS